MALNISRTFNLFSGELFDKHTYNTDMDALFNAFSGLENQTSTLGGLTITPRINSTTTLNVTNSAGTSIFSVDTVGGDIEIKTISAGLIMKSANGTRFRISMDNSGSIITESL